jgi:hypothetical protein
MVVAASLDVTEEDLQNFRDDEDVKMKLEDSPLEYIMEHLGGLLETDSAESQSREKEKTSKTQLEVVLPDNPHGLHHQVSTLDGRPVTPQDTHPRLPKSFKQTPGQKRNISDTSFGTRSTETTPTKLVHSEPKVQALMDTFVHTIIRKLWQGKIDIPWAEGRRMFLSYTACGNRV